MMGVRAKSSVTENRPVNLDSPILYSGVNGESRSGSGEHGSSGPTRAGGGVLELKSGNFGLQSVPAGDTFAVVETIRGPDGRFV